MSAPSISSPPTWVTVTRLALRPRPFVFFFSGLASVAPGAAAETGTIVDDSGTSESLKLRCDWWRERDGTPERDDAVDDGRSGCDDERERVDGPAAAADVAPERKLAKDEVDGAEPKGESGGLGVVGDLTKMSGGGGPGCCMAVGCGCWCRWAAGGGGGEGDLRNLCGSRLSLNEDDGEPGERDADGMRLEGRKRAGGYWGWCLGREGGQVGRRSAWAQPWAGGDGTGRLGGGRCCWRARVRGWLGRGCG